MAATRARVITRGAATLAILLAAITSACERLPAYDGMMLVAAVPPDTVVAAAPVRDSVVVPVIMRPTRSEPISLTLVMPVQGITPGQLRDTFAESRGNRMHEALDIHADRGTPVLSAADGRVLKIFDSERGGLMVYATDASSQYILLYGHLDSYADGLSNGMLLTRGQVIGYVGTTGNAPPDTPHLHFGILRGNPARSWSRGAPVNPFPLLMRAKL